MIQIANETCLTTQELIKKSGVNYPVKRIEYLRNLGLLPRPIKVGTSEGTKGFYPACVAEFLQKIDREHRKGASYPDLVMKYKDQIIITDMKTTNIRRTHHATKRLKSDLKRSLINVGQASGNVKLTPISTTPTEVNAQIEKTELELKRLFKQKDNVSALILQKIKSEIEKLEELQSARQVLSYTISHAKAFKGGGKDVMR